MKAREAIPVLEIMLMGSRTGSAVEKALGVAIEALKDKAAVEDTYPRGGKPRRAVIRVNEETGEVVRFRTGVEARKSLNIPAGSFGYMLLKNSLRDGYRFYYEEDWNGPVHSD